MRPRQNMTQLQTNENIFLEIAENTENSYITNILASFTSR